MSRKCLVGCGKYIADDRYYCLSCASMLGKDMRGLDNDKERSSGIDSDTEPEVTEE